MSTDDTDNASFIKCNKRQRSSTETQTSTLHISDLPHEILHNILANFDTSQGKRRGKLSQVIQAYIRDPCSVSVDKGYQEDRATLFICLNVCKLWRSIVLNVLFSRSHRCWTRKEEKLKYLGLIRFKRDAEWDRPVFSCRSVDAEDLNEELEKTERSWWGS